MSREDRLIVDAYLEHFRCLRAIAETVNHMVEEISSKEDSQTKSAMDKHLLSLRSSILNMGESLAREGLILRRELG